MNKTRRISNLGLHLQRDQRSHTFCTLQLLTILARLEFTFFSRGVKTRFLNPLYDHANNRPLPPDPDSLLPVEHPDYTGDLTCPPKLLFPQARRSHTRAHHKRTPPPKIHDDFSDDETNDLASRLELPHGFDALEGGGLRRSPRIRAKTAGATGPEL